MLSRIQILLQKLALRLGFKRDWYLIALGAAIGGVTAFGAIAFMKLLEWGSHQAASAASRWPLWTLPLIPMAGALATGFLVYRFAPEARGHGVPEVMDAIYRKGGRIRKRVASVKALASAITIGSGGSAGAEGPIVQIGSAIGSGISQTLGISREQTSTLLGCGAAAGIASVFNAPIAGFIFVLEILLRDFSLRTILPIMIASVMGAAVTQSVLGQNEALFGGTHVLEGYSFHVFELPAYAVLGVICGAIAVVFIRSLYAAEDLSERVRMHPVIKPVIGALLLGLLGIGFLMISHVAGSSATMPAFFGNGYEMVTGLLDPKTFGDMLSTVSANSPLEAARTTGHPHIVDVSLPPHFWLLGLLLVAKLAATCFTLGSGGSGGVFAPSLFLGATGGATFGVALQWLGFIPAGGSPAAYALVGMAAVVAATTHAPITAIIIVFEITRDVYVLLPIIFAAGLSIIVAQFFLVDSIYTLKLRRRGVLLGSSADLTILRRITAQQVPLAPHVAVFPDDSVSRLLELNRNYQITDFVVTDHDGRYLGMVPAQALRTALIEREAIPLLLVDDIYRSDLPVIHPDESLDQVLDKFSRNDVASLAMVADGVMVAGADQGRAVSGLITRTRLIRRYQQALTEN